MGKGWAGDTDSCVSWDHTVIHYGWLFHPVTHPNIPESREESKMILYMYGTAETRANKCF